MTAAGGRVIDPPTPRGKDNEHGWFARILDTEGNSLYLHAAAA